MIKLENESKAFTEFEHKKVLTLPQLTTVLDCSPRSVHRRLNQWKACCSYNQNARFYTLPHIPRYDSQGLWRHRNVFFSKYGNLKQTVVHLVKNSVQGFDAAEIGALIQLPPHSFMWHFRSVPGMKREKWGKTFVYFCDDPDIYLHQREARTQAEAVEQKRRLPSDADAVLILVDRIKHPGSSIQECAQRLQRRGKRISSEAVADLLDYHGIEKKTADTQSREH